MNPKTELTGRILALVYDEIRPDTQRIIDMLADYNVVHSTGMEDIEVYRHINNFLAAKRSEGRSKKTLHNYQIYLNNFNDYLRKPIAEIATVDIRSYLMYLADTRGLKVTSLQTITNTLRSFFGWLLAEEIITKNPTLRINNYVFDKRSLRHALTREELERLRDACQNYREKAVIEFLVSTGCRVSEVTGISVNQIDFNRRAVTVLGKGNKTRTVYFSVRASLMMQMYFAERKRGSALFVATREPYNAVGTRSIEKVVSAVAQRAGIIKRVYPHILRHTFASHLIDAGCDVLAVQQLLGHSDLSTTQIYVTLSGDSVRLAYDRYIA